MELLSASGESNAVRAPLTSSAIFQLQVLCVELGPVLQVLARPRHVALDNLVAAAAIYNSIYSVPQDEGGGVYATFQIVSLSGWVSLSIFQLRPRFRSQCRCTGARFEPAQGQDARQRRRQP